MIDLNLAAIVGQEGQPLSSKLTPGAIVAPHRGQYGLAVISSNAALQPLQNPLRTSTSLPHAEQVSVHTSWKADCRIFLPAERIRFVFLISSCVISEDGNAKSFSGNSVAMSKRDFSIGTIYLPFRVRMAEYPPSCHLVGSSAPAGRVLFSLMRLKDGCFERNFFITRSFSSGSNEQVE